MKWECCLKNQTLIIFVIELFSFLFNYVGYSPYDMNLFSI